MKKILSENKKVAAAGALGLAALAGLYWYKTRATSCGCSKFRFTQDPDFEKNVALYKKEANERSLYI